MNARVFVGDVPVAAIPADDRGLAYGDALFETMRAHRGDVPWWDAHWARLSQGAARVGLPLPSAARVWHEAKGLLAGADGVLKLQVSRGSGGRGYAPPTDPMPTWVLSHHPLPPKLEHVALRWCSTRLAIQPALAGLKHCNRLEQVLARAEWNDLDASDRDADEGLMCSVDGDVISATAANLFIHRNDRWLTPRVDRCGVAGVCRAWAMQSLGAEEVRIDPDDVESANAVFLCNAVRGILPVVRLGTRAWPLHSEVIALQRRLADAHPAFV